MTDAEIMEQLAACWKLDIMRTGHISDGDVVDTSAENLVRLMRMMHDRMCGVTRYFTPADIAFINEMHELYVENK